MSDRSTPDSGSAESKSPTTAPSSPPDLEIKNEKETGTMLDDAEIKELEAEENRAHAENKKAELVQRKKQAARRKRSSGETTEAKARELDELLAKSAAFSNILTKKTQVLGRVGSSLDGKALGEHNLEMAKQPSIMTGGSMRDYQLEGLTWMYEICAQGMSGILADEMGLGKTIQTISLVALLREKENYYGPHLIVAPLSTLSNWVEEYQKWTPSVPVILYHGDPTHREELREKRMKKHMRDGRPTEKFPVVCTSYEIILRDKAHLAGIHWELIIIDEGHRLKNFDSKLFKELRTFTSATRFLITGTPLQNNLKELWSLLHFLLPSIFTNWEAFESWFDFSDLQDEEGTEDFIADRKKQELVKKIHLVLQPLLLRRIKADVEYMLPKKREYLLYAPMTQEQIEMYNILSDRGADARKFLENKVVERLTQTKNTPVTSRKASPESEVKSDAEVPLRKALRGRKRKSEEAREATTPDAPVNAFERMMGRKQKLEKPEAKEKNAARGNLKRKSNDSLTSDVPNKSAKSSRQSTPAGSIRGRRARKSYKEAESSDEDKLSDDEFEKRLAEEFAATNMSDEESEDEEEIQRAKTLDLASKSITIGFGVDSDTISEKEIAQKKLGNPLMQLRLVCNSPHNFYNPWSADSELLIDETLVTSSGKMLLLDRLLPALFKRGHKVLIFSQFKTQLDILEDYARDLRGWNVCRIDGGVAQDDRRRQIKEFNEDPKHKLFLLSTRAGGQGINLASADTVIPFDSDWNPQQDLQAIDRAHRIGQKRPVVIFRLATKGTVEEELLLSAEAKRRLEKLVIKKGGFRTMGQKLDNKEELDEMGLRSILLKEGQVFQYTGKEEILSKRDLETLCDRSDEAYARAERGLGNTEGFKIVETRAGGLMTEIGGDDEKKRK